MNSNGVSYSATDIKDKLSSIVNIFRIKNEIPYFNIDLKLAHAYSESDSPQKLSIGFSQRYNFGNISRMTQRIW